MSDGFFGRARARLLSLGRDAMVAVPPAHRFFNRRLINRYANAAPARPGPWSMGFERTAWAGLVERRYSGRHLPPDCERPLPDAEAVIDLFRRTEDRRATDTSLLFPFFAQWFTDSFLRTKWKPPEIQDFAENESNHEIDLCQIYGLSEAQSDMLRAHEGGKLKSQWIDGAEWPVFLFEERDGAMRVRPEFAGLYSPENFARVFDGWTEEQKRTAFAVGLEHGNSTIGNTMMNALFLREHNRVAWTLAQAHPDWSDELLFQTARNVVTVELLRIVIMDYIVHIAPVAFPLRIDPGVAERERWYRTNRISVEFALLYRWHDLIPDTVEFGGATLPAEAMLRDNALAMRLGIEGMARDASRQKAGRIGLGNTADFLLDVKRASLKMARVCRLQPFNAYREHFGLTPITRFDALTGESVLSDRLSELYRSIDDLEWFVGIFAEAYGAKDMMGPLMVTMVAHDAFTQALTNPLLAERVYGPETFTPEGLAIIEATTTLGDVIARNSEVETPEEVGFVAREPAPEG